MQNTPDPMRCDVDHDDSPWNSMSSSRFGKAAAAEGFIFVFSEAAHLSTRKYGCRNICIAKKQVYYQ
jgi:hypothetical protein